VVTEINTQTLYEQDFNLWIEETINLLKNRQLEQIDYEHLIEEIEDMGGNRKDALESNLEQVIIHLLKWKYEPSKRTNSWQYSIAKHSTRLNKAFMKSPSLKPYFDEVLVPCYKTARMLASKQTDLPVTTFPTDLPFTKENILDPDYLPED
jgi:hypothetical protein